MEENAKLTWITREETTRLVSQEERRGGIAT